MSVNSSKSCASCHDPRFAFTDGYRTSTGATGSSLLHNAPTLINTNRYRYYDWADSSIHTYAQQIRRPLYNSHPVELGLNVDIHRIIAYLGKNDLYKSLFNRAYPGTKIISTAQIEDALISFVRSLSSFESPYDRFVRGDSNALSIEARMGLGLFFSPELNCSACHKMPLFTSNDSLYTLPADSIYFNTGLYNTGPGGQYPVGDQGLYERSKKEKDRGRFKVPALRNVALTAPYFHDGSAATLNQVIDMYSRGGRKIDKGPLAGDGRNNPYKDPRIKGFSISAAQKKALIAFLHSLTDSTILVNPNFQPPQKN